jgi:hypothetical protein
MDEVAAAIRRKTGTAISRSAMLRAIAGAVLFYYEDWLNCRSEAELQQMIARRLQLGALPKPHGRSATRTQAHERQQ